MNRSIASPLAVLLLILLPTSALGQDRGTSLVRSVESDRSGFCRLVVADPSRLESARPAERARMIDVLQKGSVGSLEERAILAILRSARPIDRADVLRLVDLGDDEFDLDELVFDEIEDGGRRRELLGLMDEAATALQAAGRLETGIISDVDDTALPHRNGPDGFAGGSLLYRYLEVGPHSEGRLGDVHFVTARPSMRMDGVRASLLLAGLPVTSLEEGSASVALFGGFDGIESEKVSDVERLLVLHPRQRFVLLGDDLDRDPEVYRRVLDSHPDRVACALIRRAGGLARRKTDVLGLVFFGRFDEAAAELRSHRLLSAAQLDSIRKAVASGG